LKQYISWDASLSNLLAGGVEAILCVIRNSCKQTYIYKIAGREDFYLGEGDQHEAKYDGKEVVVDLALHSHPNFTSTPDHCKYTMVRV
jgi:hypothetical protein